ncbi:MAG: zinc-binding dehydrogenase, partial [Armatimonadota bacterium]
MNPEIRFTGPREIEIVDAGPVEPGPGEVAVRTIVSLISAGTEGSQYTGEPWEDAEGNKRPRYPATPGYSSAGVVTAVGEGVEQFAVGDRITTAMNHVLEYTRAVDCGFLWGVPDGVSDEAATFCILGCTVLNGVRLGHPQLGDAVCVIGLGVLGQLASQYLVLTGAQTIIGIELDQSRLDLALETGAITHAVNAAEDDAGEAVRELTDGRGADFVFEVTGLTPTFNTAFDVARRFGTVIALGSPRWPAEVDMMMLHLKALNCLGAIVSSHPSPENKRNRWHRYA